MKPPGPEHTAELAALAGHPLPCERLQPAATMLAEVLTLAETLDDLDLENVEPMSTWRPPSSTD